MERGKREGRIDALLEEHGLHLERINGSVADAAKELKHLADEVHLLSQENQRSLRKVDVDLKTALRELASDIRTLKEDQKIRDTALTVAAEGIAKQTEERRGTLAAEAVAADRGSARQASVFTKRQQLATAVVGTVVGIVGLYLGTR